MRRLTYRYQHWLEHRAHAELRKRRRGSGWKFALVASKQGEKLARVLPSGDLPEILCLDRAYTETVGFIHDLRLRTSRMPSAVLAKQLARSYGRIGWIRNYQNFKSLREISPGAALLVAAEYDRARTVSGAPLSVIDLHDWNPRVYATLQNLGFFGLLDLPDAPAAQMPDGFYIQPLASEMAANSRPALDRIVDLFAKAGGDEAMRLRLSGAVVDALENVRQHAYPPDHFVGVRHVPNWWFMGAADREKKWLILAVYDQGITIPVSLPRRFGLDHVATMFRSWFSLPFDPANPSFDGEALEAAMRFSVSATGEPYRGKGLAKIREVVGNCQGGQLRIVSRNGEYVYDGRASRVTTHRVPLPGTYVEIVVLFNL
jgi:hypothetical protein